MTPTPELRWVERTEPMGEHLVRNVKVLQQKWEGEVFDEDDYSKVFGKLIAEWRDVPTAEDQP